MEVGKRYYIKILQIDGKNQPQETCELLRLNSDGTCVVRNEDGEIRLFLQNMLSEKPNEIYGNLKSIK